MGCAGSKKYSAEKPAAKAQEPKQYSWDTKEKKDPALFNIEKKNGVSVCRAANEINGEQMNIAECVNCDIFLCDFVGALFVDDCQDCRLFVGPVSSSIFLRNCSKMKVIVACQQFRTRDCKDCDFGLFCATEPIIETSVGMRFACFEFFYFSLKEQFDKAKLSVWNNLWWQIHDFNKKPGETHWSLLPQADVAKLLDVSKCTAIERNEFQGGRVVPVTLGSRPRPAATSALVVFLPDGSAARVVESFLEYAASRNDWALCQTRSLVLNAERCKALLSSFGDATVKSAVGKSVSAIEVCGPTVTADVKTLLSDTSSWPQKVVKLVPEADTAVAVKNFFENWKAEV